MEINLRSMMWHRTGNRSGVQLQFSQWLDALGLDVPQQSQSFDSQHHFVYMKHEIANVIARKKYWKFFRYNVFGGKKIDFAVWELRDPRPFVHDFSTSLRVFASACRKRFLNR